MRLIHAAIHAAQHLQTQHLPTDIQFPVQLGNYTDNFLHPVEYPLNHVFLANLWEGDFYLLSPL